MGSRFKDIHKEKNTGFKKVKKGQHDVVLTRSSRNPRTFPRVFFSSRQNIPKWSFMKISRRKLFSMRISLYQQTRNTSVVTKAAIRMPWLRCTFFNTLSSPLDIFCTSGYGSFQVEPRKTLRQTSGFARTRKETFEIQWEEWLQPTVMSVCVWWSYLSCQKTLSSPKAKKKDKIFSSIHSMLGSVCFVTPALNVIP